MQRLWTETLDWDDPLPPRLASEFEGFDLSLASVPSLSVPRWIGVTRSILGIEIHGFSDASQEALAAVVYIRVYIRVLAEFDEVRVNLLAAKSKVAPLAKQTIPRLELSAAVLLVRLVRRVSAVLNLETAPVHLWVDSSVALTWLRGSPAQWKEYVANRVALAHELLPRAHWHHVSGAENPADCASRRLSPQLLAAHGAWWRGPDWLSGPSTTWPSSALRFDVDTDLEARPRRTHLAAAAAVDSTWDLAARYSSLRRLIRITAWIQRAVDRLRRRPPTHHDLGPADLARAEQLWITLEQHTAFHTEIPVLSRGDALPRSHPLLRLSPFVDGNCVLRVGGRLRNALLDPDAKHPVLLPRDSHLTRLILDDVHRRTLHGGVQSMLATIRQRYWIVGGCALIASFVRRCVRCARYRASTATQLMGQLPPTRVTPARPFLTSGVDYAGPFSIKTWRARAARTYKGFLVVFVCFATSAVHLELATDYSTQGFLPRIVVFGADAELRRLFDVASAEFAATSHALASDGTQWSFNPAGAPHFGGKWEAAVKSVKHHLRRVIGDTLLTYEEFTTLLTQVEEVLNSRPLCPLSDDPADVEALTPAHFLVGGPFSSVPEPSLTDVAVSRLSRWQHFRQMLDHLWRRWSTEYLQRLQALAKWKVSSDRIRVGTLVLLTDERYPPSKWPLARVIEVHPGQDALIRVATIRTSNTTLKRPIVKLCPLPVDSVNVPAQSTDS
ncbi:PREDICTED: uncharacterized protein LOC105557211 [Vollenhovia emeryi]|uniref:uncharacterized protein LOC105557211 n=1 Tax=Vollenhovia emeryi TaxID=411798 RepID=UPI0005F3EEA2|nr:PREDICTED: uncharacterized protein LOC105557211 [Vollenhovia emeryi]